MMKIGGIKPKGVVGKPIWDSMLVPINLGQCRGMWLSSNLVLVWVWVQVPADHMAITPNGYSRRHTWWQSLPTAIPEGILGILGNQRLTANQWKLSLDKHTQTISGNNMSGRKTPTLYNSHTKKMAHNHCPCARPAHVCYSWSWARLNCSKTGDVVCSCKNFKLCQY